jgi:hypothetical protein
MNLDLYLSCLFLFFYLHLLDKEKVMQVKLLEGGVEGELDKY